MLELTPNFKDKLFNTLLKIEPLAERENRDFLLRNLPRGAVGTINRSNAFVPDLNKIINAVESFGQLDSGEWALVVLTKNALMITKGTEHYRVLENLLAELETFSTVTILEPIPLKLLDEVVIGVDERLPVSFLERGLIASKAVAKVLVPRVIDGNPQEGKGTGTGWLITPSLLITNYHVVEARDRRKELPASEADFREQALRASAWFDYVIENQEYSEYKSTELVHFNRSLDYSLLRLSSQTLSGSSESLTKWGYLSVAQLSPELTRSDRLNIVQHPQGGVKRIAIRSNFYVDRVSTDASPNRIRYLTDTEPGSSGSPVFNDAWEVIALHHAAVEVPESKQRGEIIKYNNQGILIHAILENLPNQILDEIYATQKQLT